MFLIEKTTNNITLTRGDTAEIEVSLVDDDGTVYEMQPGDFLTFSMKKDLNDKTYALKKYTDGTNIFKFVPSDTASLSFGKYKYDVQLTTSEGAVYTVIPPSVFTVGEEVSE